MQAAGRVPRAARRQGACPRRDRGAQAGPMSNRDETLPTAFMVTRTTSPRPSPGARPAPPAPPCSTGAAPTGNAAPRSTSISCPSPLSVQTPQASLALVSGEIGSIQFDHRSRIRFPLVILRVRRYAAQAGISATRTCGGEDGRTWGAISDILGGSRNRVAARGCTRIRLPPPPDPSRSHCRQRVRRRQELGPPGPRGRGTSPELGEAALSRWTRSPRSPAPSLRRG